MKVSELMTTPAVTCCPDDTLACAAQLMWDHDCGALPVVSGDGTVIGVITDRDVCMAAWTQGQTLHAISVASAMSKQVFTCRGGETIEAVRRVMREKRVRRVPIVDDANRPIGLLSVNDLARDSARSGKTDKDVVQTLASICEPRLARTLEPARQQRELVGAAAGTPS